MQFHAAAPEASFYLHQLQEGLVIVCFILRDEELACLRRATGHDKHQSIIRVVRINGKCSCSDKAWCGDVSVYLKTGVCHGRQ